MVIVDSLKKPGLDDDGGEDQSFSCRVGVIVRVLYAGNGDSRVCECGVLPAASPLSSEVFIGKLEGA